MTERYELKSPRKGKDGKTFWTRVGVAFPNKNGDGFNLILEAYPLPDAEGRVMMTMMPPFERDEGHASKQQSRPAPERRELDDDIPF